MEKEIDQEMLDVEKLVYEIFKVLDSKEGTIAIGALASCQSIIISRYSYVPDSINHAFFEDYISKLKSIVESYGYTECMKR